MLKKLYELTKGVETLEQYLENVENYINRNSIDTSLWPLSDDIDVKFTDKKDGPKGVTNGGRNGNAFGLNEPTEVSLVPNKLDYEEVVVRVSFDEIQHTLSLKHFKTYMPKVVNHMLEKLFEEKGFDDNTLNYGRLVFFKHPGSDGIFKKLEFANRIEFRLYSVCGKVNV